MICHVLRNFVRRQRTESDIQAGCLDSDGRKTADFETRTQIICELKTLVDEEVRHQPLSGELAMRT